MEKADSLVRNAIKLPIIWNVVPEEVSGLKISRQTLSLTLLPKGPRKENTNAVLTPGEGDH